MTGSCGFVFFCLRITIEPSASQYRWVCSSSFPQRSSLAIIFHVFSLGLSSQSNATDILFFLLLRLLCAFLVFVVFHPFLFRRIRLAFLVAFFVPSPFSPARSAYDGSLVLSFCQRCFPPPNPTTVPFFFFLEPVSVSSQLVN